MSEVKKLKKQLAKKLATAETEKDLEACKELLEDLQMEIRAKSIQAEYIPGKWMLEKTCSTFSSTCSRAILAQAIR